MGEAHDPVGAHHHDRSAVEAERAEHAVRLGDLLVDVGEEREREAVLRRERLVARHVLRADAEQLGAEPDERAEVVVVAVELHGAHRRVIAGIEREHDRLPALRGQRVVAAAGARKREVGCDLAAADHVRPRRLRAPNPGSLELHLQTAIPGEP